MSGEFKQAPIVHVVFIDGMCRYSQVISPGLPDGPHDLYVDPNPEALTHAYAEGRKDEREAAIAHFEKTARETEDQSQFGKAFWCRAAAQALRNGWHS